MDHLPNIVLNDNGLTLLRLEASLANKDTVLDFFVACVASLFCTLSVVSSLSRRRSSVINTSKVKWVTATKTTLAFES